MRVIIKKNYEECAKWTANFIADKIKRFRPTADKPFVLGLPTGSTPLGVYKELIESYKEDRKARIKQREEFAHFLDGEKRGTTNYLEVLTTQSNLFAAELTQQSANLENLSAVINLYKAFGGGWDKSKYAQEE